MYIDCTAPIVPGRSIANISLGDKVEDVVKCLQSQAMAYEELAYEVGGLKYLQIAIENGMIGLIADASDRVVRVWCRRPYQGSYEDVIFPGMTVGHIVASTFSQSIACGVLEVNREYGMHFDIPDVYAGKCYDDIDTIDQLPDDMTLDEISVTHRDWR